MYGVCSRGLVVEREFGEDGSRGGGGGGCHSNISIIRSGCVLNGAPRKVFRFKYCVR